MKKQKISQIENVILVNEFALSFKENTPQGEKRYVIFEIKKEEHIKHLIKIGHYTTEDKKYHFIPLRARYEGKEKGYFQKDEKIISENNEIIIQIKANKANLKNLKRFFEKNKTLFILCKVEIIDNFFKYENPIKFHDHRFDVIPTFKWKKDISEMYQVKKSGTLKRAK